LDGHDALVDVAGGQFGGAARWRAELQQYLSHRSRPVRLIGNGHRLTGRWLLRRERLARGASLVFATNNVSFGLAGRQRRVLLHNALHFLYPHEANALAKMPAGWSAQIPIVRHMAQRADQVVVPCSAMAERVLFHLPALRNRMAVYPHPITPVGPRVESTGAFILAPVVPGRYKNLFPQLRMLTTVLRHAGQPFRVRVTAAPTALPADLAADERVEAVGIVPHSRLAQLWRSAHAAFFPSTLEAFGFPLAEARVYGVPVLAPLSDQARELAGSALRGYDPDVPATLAEAIDRIAEPVVPEPDAFNRERYFGRLLADGPAV